MHEPITIAKVRKAVTIKVPAGGWIIIASPDQPFTEHHTVRSQLAAGGQTNDQYQTVVCGRFDNKYRNLVFLTAADLAAQKQEALDAEKAVAKSVEAANKLQAKKNADEQEKAKANHKSEVAKANLVNASIAGRDFAGASHKEIPIPNLILTDEQIASEAAAEKAAADALSAANEADELEATKQADAAADGPRKELLLKSRGDLLKIAEEYKVTLPTPANKLALVDAILATAGYTTPKAQP